MELKLGSRDGWTDLCAYYFVRKFPLQGARDQQGKAEEEEGYGGVDLSSTGFYQVWPPLDFTEQSSEKLCKWHLLATFIQRAGEDLYLLTLPPTGQGFTPWGTNFSIFLGCICVGSGQGPEIPRCSVTGHTSKSCVAGTKAGYHQVVPMWSQWSHVNLEASVLIFILVRGEARVVWSEPKRVWYK